MIFQQCVLLLPNWSEILKSCTVCYGKAFLAVKNVSIGRTGVQSLESRDWSGRPVSGGARAARGLKGMEARGPEHIACHIGNPEGPRHMRHFHGEQEIKRGNKRLKQAEEVEGGKNNSLVRDMSI